MHVPSISSRVHVHTRDRRGRSEDFILPPDCWQNKSDLGAFRGNLTIVNSRATTQTDVVRAGRLVASPSLLCMCDACAYLPLLISIDWAVLRRAILKFHHSRLTYLTARSNRSMLRHTRHHFYFDCVISHPSGYTGRIEFDFCVSIYLFPVFVSITIPTKLRVNFRQCN